MVGHAAGRLGRLPTLARLILALALGASALTGGLPGRPAATPIAHAAAGAVGTGHLWITGHDDDKHCWQSTAPACVYMKAAIDFVRDGSSLPVLALDSGPDISATVAQAYSSGAPTLDVVDPSGPAFARLPLVNGSGTPLYSAIVVASDSTCPSCDNPVTDTMEIVARKADIAQFFNEGGGILAMAGADHYSTYYNFLPITATGAAVTPPFSVTAVGQSIGLYDTGSSATSPINCCGTHNSFDLPGPGSPLRVAETDSNNLAETEVVTGQIIDQAPNTGNFVPSSMSDLWMTSTHADPITAGTGVSYTLQITNGAGMTAGSIVVTDTVTGPLTLDGASGGADWSCSTSGQTATCSYQGAGIPYTGQAPPIVIRAHTAPNASGSAANSATVTAANDVNHANDTATDPTTITSSADLAVTNAASPNPVIAGQDVTYTAVVTNTGPSDAGAYTFQERVPANTTFQRAIGPSCSAPDNTGLVSCNAPGLAAGATQTYQFVVGVAPSATTGTAIMATARLATLATTDPNLSNNSAAATATVATSADLFVTSVNAALNSATAGQDVTYATTFGNNGPSVATNAVLTMTVPAGTTFVSANGGGVFSCPNAPDGQGRVVCTAANVSATPNAVAHLTVHVRPSTLVTGTLTSQSTLTSSTPDPDPTNNSATGSAGVQTAADLSVGVTFSPHPVVAGQVLTYTTTLSNAGPSDAAAPVVTTTLPTRTTFVSLAAPNGWTCMTPSPGSGGTVSCTPTGGASLAARSSATFALVVLADQGVLTGTVLSATSTASSQTTDPISANNTATADANATTSSDLGVTSSLAPNLSVAAGQTLTDTVTVTNGGPSAAAAPAVTTTIPAGTTVRGLTSPGDWTCATPTVGGSGTVSCTPNGGASLAAGAAAQFVLTLGVAPNVPAGTSIGVTATTGSQTNDPNQTNNASTATVTVATVADLAVSNAASSPVVAGLDVTYTTTLVNNGPSDAPNPVVTATVPAGATFGSLTAPNGWTCGAPNAGGVVTCMAPTLAAGRTVSFPLVVRVAASVPAGVTLTSDTGAADAFDPDTSNNTASLGAQVGRVADLAVTVAAAPSPVVAGQSVTYTAALTNTGPSDAAATVFTATIPAGTTFQSVTPAAGWACVPPAPGSSGVVSCQPPGGSLAAGAHATIAFQLAVSPAASLRATLSSVAAVSSASADPTPANNSATAVAAVTTSTALAVSETASPAPVIAGQDATYTATLTNTGPSDAASPVVTLTVPTSTTVGSLTTPNGWTCSSPDASGVVTCTTPTLPAGQTVSFPLVVRVAASVRDGLTLTSATGASTATTNSNEGNNTASAGARVVARADLQLTNIAVPMPLLPGQTVTYRAAVTNAGPSDARGVVFTETVPPGTTFVAVTAPDGWTCTSAAAGAGVVSCTTATVAAGATGTVALSVRIDPSAPGGTILTTASTISSATVDPDASNNSSTARVTVLQTPPTATAAPANTATATNMATGTPVPTGTATNTATATPANTAASTIAPAATSSPTTPADTATTAPTIAPSSPPLPAAPDFRPINGAQLGVESAVPLFTAHRRGTLSIADARGFTPRSPVRVSIAAAGTTRTLAHPRRVHDDVRSDRRRVRLDTLHTARGGRLSGHRHGPRHRPPCPEGGYRPAVPPRVPCPRDTVLRRGLHRCGLR